MLFSAGDHGCRADGNWQGLGFKVEGGIGLRTISLSLSVCLFLSLILIFFSMSCFFFGGNIRMKQGHHGGRKPCTTKQYQWAVSF